MKNLLPILLILLTSTFAFSQESETIKYAPMYIQLSSVAPDSTVIKVLRQIGKYSEDGIKVYLQVVPRNTLAFQVSHPNQNDFNLVNHQLSLGRAVWFQHGNPKPPCPPGGCIQAP